MSDAPLPVLHLIWGLEMGGAQKIIAAIARHSPAGAFRHGVVSFHGDGPARPEIEAAGCAAALLNKRRGFDPAMPGALRRLTAGFPRGIMHAHDFTGAFWGRLALRGSPGWRLAVTDHLASQALCAWKLGFSPHIPRPTACTRCAGKALLQSRPPCHTGGHSLPKAINAGCPLSNLALRLPPACAAVRGTPAGSRHRLLHSVFPRLAPAALLRLRRAPTGHPFAGRGLAGLLRKPGSALKGPVRQCACYFPARARRRWGHCGRQRIPGSTQLQNKKPALAKGMAAQVLSS